MAVSVRAFLGRAGVMLAGCLVILAARPGAAEPIRVAVEDPSAFVAHHVTIDRVPFAGSPSLQVRLVGPYRGPDTDTFAMLNGVDFHDGSIDVDVAGAPLPDAPAGARGFVGLALRIDPAAGFGFEGFYVRPTNGRAEDQVRRNHSTQYFSYPGYDFDRLRREAPGQYESYVDLVPGEWTHLRVVVLGATARLYVGGASQPALIVRDLKRGADAHGGVGLYVDQGTDGHFRNLVITPD